MTEKKTEFSLHDVVAIVSSSPNYFGRENMEGTIAYIFSGVEEAYEVEFCDEDGKTLEVLTLLRSEVVHSYKVV